MKNLYISVETKVRELDAKLLIACIAAEKGIDVYIGELNAFKGSPKRPSILDKLPKGVLLYQNAANWSKNLIALCEKNGHELVVMDEEGLVFGSDEEYIHERISMDVFHFLNMFYSVGENQLRLVNNYVNALQSKNHLVGNPRFDLLRPEINRFFLDETKKNQQKHGKFILINTHFFMYNHFSGEGYYLQFYKKRMKEWTPEDEAYLKRNIEHYKKKFEEFKRIIPLLAEQFKDHKIIIRPHPGENFQTWQAIKDERGQIDVIHEGNVVPWILASDIVLHSGCTTGIESYLLNKPVISYLPFYDTAFDRLLPNDISNQVFDFETLLSKMKDIIGTQDGYYTNTHMDKNALLEMHIAGIKIEEPFAAEKIVTLLEQANLFSEQPMSHLHHTNTKKNVMLTSLKFGISILRNVKKNFNRRKYIKRSAYDLHKFPYTDVKEIAGKVKKLASITGRFHSLHVKEIYDSVYMINTKKR